MSTTVSESGSLVRVSVLCRGRRADLAVPGQLPVCDLLPELAAAVQALDPYLVHGGYRLVRADGTTLLPNGGLAAQGVLDGGTLTLELGANDPVPRVYDDVVEAVADTIAEQVRPWDTAASRRTALVAAALLLAVASGALAVERRTGLPIAAAAAALAVLLVVGSAVLARASGETETALVLAWSAVLPAAVAGFAAAPDRPVLRLPLALAGIGILVVGVLGVALLRTSRAALLPAVVVGAATLVTGAVLSSSPHLQPARVVAVVLTAAVLLGTVVPLLAMSATRVNTPAPRTDADLLADPEPLDRDAVARQIRIGRQVLIGLSVSTGLLLVLGAPFLVRLGVSGVLLGIAACVVVLLRARQARARQDVATAMVCGVAGLVALSIASASLQPDSRPVLATVLAVVGLVLLVVAAAPRPASVRLGRAADVAEATALISLLPLLVLAVGLVAAVRS